MKETTQLQVSVAASSSAPALQQILLFPPAKNGNILQLDALDGSHQSGVPHFPVGGTRGGHKGAANQRL